MPTAPPVRLFALVLLLAACGRTAADTRPPDAPAPDEASDADQASDPAAPVAGKPTAAQTIRFDDDADPEPTTQVRSPPKRPPIPAFELFGTRKSDGP